MIIQESNGDGESHFAFSSYSHLFHQADREIGWMVVRPVGTHKLVEWATITSKWELRLSHTEKAIAAYVVQGRWKREDATIAVGREKYHIDARMKWLEIA